MKKCVFAGTFDPPTSGHRAVVDTCLKIFDEVVVAVMVNTKKSPLLSEEQRKILLEKLFCGNPAVKVVIFEGAAVDLLKQENTVFYVRGVRSGIDFEYETADYYASKKLMPGLVELCRKYGLVLIEDSTEALGTYYTEGPYRGKMAGTIGDIGVYSFNGNKIITTGAGGMVVSNHADWLERAKHLSTQAKADELQFVHDEVGYNYRLTNLQAALGLAQLEQLEGFIAHKNEMYDFYKERLDGKNGYRILPFRDGVRSNKWFYSLYLEDARHTRDGVIAALKAQNIQTRPVWALIHEQAAATRPTALQWPRISARRSSTCRAPRT